MITKTTSRAYELFKEAQALEVNGYLINVRTLHKDGGVSISHTDDNGHTWNYDYSKEELENAEFEQNWMLIKDEIVGDTQVIKFFKLESIL